MAAVRAGDDRAFEALWERYHRRIAAYVNGMVNDHARAEDITQDVFISALRRMRETDRAIAFKPWVYEIAKNACIDAFRRSRRTEEVSYHADGGLPSADQVRLVSSSPTPDVAVDQRMSLDDLRGAFGGLSETHHAILVMRELEGLSYREIGERLGMSRPSVESTLFRARRRLSEEYEELVSGERCRRVQGMFLTASATALGARDARRMSKHVSHCSGCRRQAAIAGFDITQLAARPLRQRVAAVLPLPAFLRKRFGGADEAAAVATQPAAAHWAASLVGQYVEPAALSGWAKAAAAAATIAVAGVGAGAATDPERMGFGGRDESVPPVAAPEDSDASGAAVSAQRAPAGVPVGASASSSTARDGASRPARDARRGRADASDTGPSGRSGGSSSTTQPASQPSRDLMPHVELRSGGGSSSPATSSSPTPAASGGKADVLPAKQPSPAVPAVPAVPSGASARVPSASGGAPQAPQGPRVGVSASASASTSAGASATNAAGGTAAAATQDARHTQVGTAIEQSGSGTVATLDAE